MPLQDFVYNSLDKNFFLKKMLSVLLALSSFVYYYIYSSFIIVNIEFIYKTFLAAYFYILKIILATSITGLFLFYYKNNFNFFASKLLLILWGFHLLQNHKRFLIMDRSDYPSVLYIRLFPNRIKQ